MSFEPFSPSLLYQWVFIDDKIQLIANSLKGTDMENSEINAGLGYLYLDPQLGSSLHLEQALILGGEKHNQTFPIDPEKGGFFVFRHSGLKAFAFQILSDQGRQEWELHPIPVVLKVPSVPQTVKNMLKNSLFDPFRSPSHPNNIQFCIGTEGLKVETVWGAYLQELPQENLYAVILLNEPHQDFGVHEGDILPVMYQPENDGGLFIWMPKFGTLNTEIT